MTATQQNNILDTNTDMADTIIKEASITTSTNNKVNPFAKRTTSREDISEETVYDFYSKNVLPAIWSSVPILLSRMAHDSKDLLKLGASKFLHFLLPKHWAESMEERNWSAPSLAQLWEQSPNSTVQEFLLRHFDTNEDGHISSNELINMTEFMEMWHKSASTPRSWYQWVSKEWPMMDWKIGVFLWRTFGGILVTLCVLSIIPGRLHGISARILRWPVLAITYFLIAVELFVYVIIRLGIRIAEALIAKPKHRKLRRQMTQAKSYEEWYELAAKLDKSQKRDKWQAKVDEKTSKRYNWSFIFELIKDMKRARKTNDSLLALAVLQQCTRKNVGGVMSEDLFSYTNTGEPMFIVRDFIDEVVKTMEWVTDEALKLPDDTEDNEDEGDIKGYEDNLENKIRHEKDKIWKSLIKFATTMSFDDKLKKTSNHDGSVSSVDSATEFIKPDHTIAEVNNLVHTQDKDGAKLPSTFHRKQVIEFFRRARASFGRTALCLSGGAMMGVYHFGHVRGLLEAGALPSIISGTSAGAVIAATICTRTDEELLRDFTPAMLSQKLTCFSRPWGERFKSLFSNGHLFSKDEWLDLIKWFTMGDMTFEEAYRKTGRLLCITVSATTKKAPPVLLNHLSAPNVTIASAVVSSAAVPGFIPPMKLRYKLSNGTVCENHRDQTYFDGSVDSDIPVNGLAEMLNCQFFIAAQCNPHVVPFFYNPKGSVGRPSRWSSGNHEHSWRGGFLLATLEMYLKNDMKAKFRFLNDLEAAVGFTSTLMVQEFQGSTTLVPQVSFGDFFKLLSNPTLQDMYRCMQVGSIAAYEHIAMIKKHYKIADSLDSCLDALESGTRRDQTDRPVLWLRHHPEVEEGDGDSGRPASEITTSENETVSTDSSLNENDDDDHAIPGKWEPIRS